MREPYVKEACSLASSLEVQHALAHGAVASEEIFDGEAFALADLVEKSVASGHRVSHGLDGVALASSLLLLLGKEGSELFFVEAAVAIGVAGSEVGTDASELLCLLLFCVVACLASILGSLLLCGCDSLEVVPALDAKGLEFFSEFRGD